MVVKISLHFLQTLLNFAEQMGEVKPKGLSRVEIDQLPTYRVTAGAKEEAEEKRCVVCLVDFEEKQLVRVLPCLHEYHTRCIDKWLKVRAVLISKDYKLRSISRFWARVLNFMQVTFVVILFIRWIERLQFT